uniref:Autophagy-related protein 2 n=1 Tax=Bionectria ochroleuca TaxID=29856 RepID=A0A8H7NF87_BIOOC
MASFFQSFRSSSMPKRLLRYALARLDLLDSESLDMDNLDLALGKNTVFEFRDVGVKLKKLEKLLRLPDSLTLQKSKVHVLRITIPMDFFTSPILVEVDGVSVSVRVSGREFTSSPPDGNTTKDSSIVPDPVDLAQEFLKTQPSSERVRLEEALALETQDLGASVSVSEDGSDEEAPLGTGQSLSLPAFMADFIQGIIDRTQIKIKGVSFQLEVEVPLDPNSPAPELVSFQIALEDIDVEGVTTSSPVLEPESAHVGLKEGKRRVLLNNVRAYLISEANVFSTFAQSPSSPSLLLSPKLTRSSSTHDHEDLLRSHHDDDDQNMSNSQYSVQSESNQEYQDSSDRSGSPLGDSEVALDIPYDFEEREEENVEDEGPATPRASVYHGLDESLEQSVDQSVFHSTYLPDRRLANTTAFEADVPQWASTHTEARSEPAYVDALPLDSSIAPETEPTTASPVIGREDRRSSSGSEEDLTQSHLYTREEAESMYLSAFSSDERASLRGSTYSEAPGSHLQAIPATTREDPPKRLIP